MSLIVGAIGAVERTPLPDSVTRAGIGWLVARSRRRLAGSPAHDARFAADMATRRVAEHADKANAQHYRIQKGQSKVSIGEAIRQWFALRDDVDVEQIEIEISFDKQSRFILVPLHIKWRNVSRVQNLPPVSAPLSFNARHQSELWKSQIERCRKASPDAFGWTADQFKRFVSQRSQPCAKGADERDLLRLAGAFDRLGLKVGPYLKTGYDCP